MKSANRWAFRSSTLQYLPRSLSVLRLYPEKVVRSRSWEEINAAVRLTSPVKLSMLKNRSPILIAKSTI